MSLKNNKTTLYRRFGGSKCLHFNPELTQAQGVNTWTLNRVLSFYVDPRKEETWVSVPTGFEYSGPVIPTYFKRFFGSRSKMVRAGILHQYLRNDGDIQRSKKAMKATRQEADKVFLQALEVENVPYLVRQFYYLLTKLT